MPGGNGEDGEGGNCNELPHKDLLLLACLAAGIFVPVGFFKGRYSRLEGGAQVQNVLVRSFDPRAREPGRRMLRMKRWDASSQMRRLDLASTPIREACRRAAGRNDWDSRNNGRAAP